MMIPDNDKNTITISTCRTLDPITLRTGMVGVYYNAVYRIHVHVHVVCNVPESLEHSVLKIIKTSY